MTGFVGISLDLSRELVRRFRFGISVQVRMAESGGNGFEGGNFNWLESSVNCGEKETIKALKKSGEYSEGAIGAQKAFVLTDGLTERTKQSVKIGS